MCNLCNGRHMIHQVEKGLVSVVPCPNSCGPSPEEWKRKMDFLAARIEEAEKRFKKEKVAV